MRVMFEVTARMHTMTKGKVRRRLGDVKALLREDGDFLRPLVQMVVQELLEAEMSAALGAEKGDRPAARCRPNPPTAPRTRGQGPACRAGAGAELDSRRSHPVLGVGSRRSAAQPHRPPTLTLAAEAASG
jgi:hypothetical protein